MEKIYKFFLISSLVLVFLVIAAGATVRMTGSGMGCPDWPKCFGYLIPPINRSQLDWKAEYEYKKGQVIILNESLHVAFKDFKSKNNYNPKNWIPYTKHDYAIFNPIHTWIEFLNRILGAIAGLATLILLIAALFRFKKDNIAGLITFLVVIGMAFQAWLGKTVVDSNLVPYKITIHMVMALIILLFLIFLLEREIKFLKKLPSIPIFKNLIIISLILTLAQIAMGTQIRQFVDEQIDFWGFEAPFKWLNNAPFIFYFHRSFSLSVLIINVWIGSILYKYKYIPIEFLCILLLIGLEIVTGILMYYFNFPFSSQPLHLLFSSLLFGAQTFFIIRVIKQK